MKLKVGFGLFVFILISIVSAHAQTFPCGGTDPDATCPLDTWVVVLAVAAMVFAALRLYRKNNLVKAKL